MKRSVVLGALMGLLWVPEVLNPFQAGAAAALNGPARAQAAQSQDEDGYTVRGRVINSVTRAPVPRALVFTADNRYAKLTDDEGHFEFKMPHEQPQQGSRSETGYFGGSHLTRPSSLVVLTGVPLLARKPGYFQSTPQQSGTYGEGNGSQELTIELVPEALIAGRVNVAANDGTNTMQVAIYRREVREGHGQWVPANSTTTRASGEFRFANLQAGDYKLFTQDMQDRDPVAFNPRQLFGYPPVYYPAANDFESAAVIHLKAGDTFSATLTPSRTEYYPVRLGMANADSLAGIRMELETQGHRGPGFSLGYSSNNTIQGLLPNGNYRLEVTKYGEIRATGLVDFSVNGAPLQGPSATLLPDAVIEARVRDERTKGDNGIAPGARNLLNMMNLAFIPTDGFAQVDYLRLRPANSPDDERLVFGDLQPGSYRVRARCQPWGYVAAMRSGETDLLQQPLVVGLGAAVPPLEITVRDDGAMVTGSIENWPPPGQPQGLGGFSESPPTVVLLPTAGSGGQFCQTWTGPKGEFAFQEVAPGEYLAVAFDHLREDLEYDDPKVMEKLESKGKVLRVVADQKERVQLGLNAGGGSD